MEMVSREGAKARRREEWREKGIFHAKGAKKTGRARRRKVDAGSSPA
jgi:hypothetical protein